MFVVIVLLLLLAAAAGVLGWVIKVTAIVVLSIILAVIILGVGTYYYVRHRLKRFVKRAQTAGRAYPTTGEKRGGPELPQ